MPKGSSFDRAFKLLAMLERPQGVTVREIKKTFGISWQSARRMINEMSIYKPVFEDGKVSSAGNAAKIYRLLKNDR
jgi:DNA-binding IclR family transcriptional regulator